MRSVLRDSYRQILANLPPALSTRMQFFVNVGHWPNISEPRTFNEKVLKRKLTENDGRFALCADKVRVKHYVMERLGPQFIIPTLWDGKALPAAMPDDWPERVVVKANHASGWNAFVSRGDDIAWAQARRHSARWLSKPWAKHVHERWYNRIERRILVEPFIGEAADAPADYKLFVFDGKVQMIQVDTDRFSGHKRDLFSPAFEHLQATLLYPNNPVRPKAPKHLEAMLSAASVLGQGFDFVRIDFYDLPSGPIFGEMTFAPDAGNGRFVPRTLDEKLGQFWG